MNYNNLNKDKLIEMLVHQDYRLRKLELENKRLNYLASIDPMTEVLNRNAGLELLEKEVKLANLSSKPIVISFIDIDKLKSINDTFGHNEGDNLLIKVAQILKQGIRKNDYVIRMGGDEFLVIFPETSLEQANKAWERVLKLINQQNTRNEKYELSISYGFYEHSKYNKKISISKMIEKADMEMYKLKCKKTFKGGY